jgi:hypothetical protein
VTAGTDTVVVSGLRVISAVALAVVMIVFLSLLTWITSTAYAMSGAQV